MWVFISVIFTLFPYEDSLRLFSVIEDIRKQNLLSLLLLQLV